MIFLKKILSSKGEKINYHEIMVIGKSNIGKSSILGAISGNLGISKTSKFPGKTKSGNLFQLKKNIFITDLPGYGYNSLSKKNSIRIEQLLINNLIGKKNILGIILLININYSIISFDYNIIEIAIHYQIPLHILFSKSDKLNYRDIEKKLHLKSIHYHGYECLVSYQLFSLFNKYSIQHLIHKLNLWIS